MGKMSMKEYLAQRKEREAHHESIGTKNLETDRREAANDDPDSAEKVGMTEREEAPPPSNPRPALPTGQLPAIKKSTVNELLAQKIAASKAGLPTRKCNRPSSPDDALITKGSLTMKELLAQRIAKSQEGAPTGKRHQPSSPDDGLTTKRSPTAKALLAQRIAQKERNASRAAERAPLQRDDDGDDSDIDNKGSTDDLSHGLDEYDADADGELDDEEDDVCDEEDADEESDTEESEVPRSTRRIDKSGASADHSVAKPDVPVPKKDMTYPVHAFGSQADTIRTIAKAVQVSEEMAGSVILSETSALAQALINVSSRKSGKGCPVSVNVCIVAASGERKSSALGAVAKPMYAAISRALDERRFMLVQDVTVDGLVVGLITRCPAQYLVAPEGASLMGGHAMSRDNLNRFLGTVSSVYSDEPLSRIRVEEHHYAYDRRLSVLLFAQPIVAMEFLSSPMITQQGLGNRFLYSQPPSLLGTRLHVDIELDEEPVYQQYCEKITALANQEWKINPITGGVDTRTVRMTAEAKAAWVQFYNRLEVAAGPGGYLATHAGYVTRFHEQVMRIAALLAMLDDPKVECIAEETMFRAIELGNYYLATAIKLFNAAPANKDEMDAKTLLDWMHNKMAELGAKAIPVRMIYKDGPRCARSSKRAKELLTLLEDRGDVVKYTDTICYGDGKRSADNYAVVGM